MLSTRLRIFFAFSMLAHAIPARGRSENHNLFLFGKMEERNDAFVKQESLIKSRPQRDTHRVDVAISILFRTLGSLHDVVHVRNPHPMIRV